jgi:hypothetical protein
MKNPLYVLIIPSEYFVAASYIAGAAFMKRSLRQHSANPERSDLPSVSSHSCPPLTALYSVSLTLG